MRAVCFSLKIKENKCPYHVMSASFLQEKNHNPPYFLRGEGGLL